MTPAGKQPPLDLARFEGWLHAVANRLLGLQSADHDDLVNEGRIAMWRAGESFDGRDKVDVRGALIAWSIRAAEMRMKDLAHGHGRPFGHTPVRGMREVRVAMHLDALAEDFRADLEPIAQDVAEAAMWAYHTGQIGRAVADLTEHQREAVLHLLSDGLLTGRQRANLAAARRNLRSVLDHLRNCSDYFPG